MAEGIFNIETLTAPLSQPHAHAAYRRKACFDTFNPGSEQEYNEPLETQRQLKQRARCLRTG